MKKNTIIKAFLFFVLIVFSMQLFAQETKISRMITPIH